VPDVFRYRSPQVALAQRNDPLEALAPDRKYEPLRERVLSTGRNPI
jgi:hypothetical protein